ncbi:hypothetical protein B0H13DRAFT_1907315 [Mycena leptocephala]|nr:hypothetical protein B0H13DRAFT_1907315 [Mycena leptocephala]
MRQSPYLSRIRPPSLALPFTYDWPVLCSPLAVAESNEDIEMETEVPEQKSERKNIEITSQAASPERPPIQKPLPVRRPNYGREGALPAGKMSQDLLKLFVNRNKLFSVSKVEHYLRPNFLGEQTNSSTGFQLDNKAKSKAKSPKAETKSAQAAAKTTAVQVPSPKHQNNTGTRSSAMNNGYGACVQLQQPNFATRRTLFGLVDGGCEGASLSLHYIISAILLFSLHHLPIGASSRRVTNLRTPSRATPSKLIQNYSFLKTYYRQLGCEIGSAEPKPTPSCLAPLLQLSLRSGSGIIGRLLTIPLLLALLLSPITLSSSSAILLCLLFSLCPPTDTFLFRTLVRSPVVRRIHSYERFLAAYNSETAASFSPTNINIIWHIFYLVQISRRSVTTGPSFGMTFPPVSSVILSVHSRSPRIHPSTRVSAPTAAITQAEVYVYRLTSRFYYFSNFFSVRDATKGPSFHLPAFRGIGQTQFMSINTQMRKSGIIFLAQIVQLKPLRSFPLQFHLDHFEMLTQNASALRHYYKCSQIISEGANPSWQRTLNTGTGTMSRA